MRMWIVSAAEFPALMELLVEDIHEGQIFSFAVDQVLERLYSVINFYMQGL